MTEQINFNEEWDKTKKQLVSFTREVAQLIKKGEKEAVKLSKKSKLHIDAATISLRIEQLYYLIGKEYLKLTDKRKASPKLELLVKEAKKISKDKMSIERSLGKIK